MAFTINNGADSPLDSIYVTDYWIVNKWFGDRRFGWGNNSFGQLGDNSTVHKSSPVQTISSGTNWKSIASGGSNVKHVLAVKTDGTLWGCGYNTQGQLGDNTRTSKSSPVQTVSGSANWSQAACGEGHSAAIKTDGTLWMWGLCNYGQLGDNSSVSKSSPVQTIAGGTNWRQVACGERHTSAIKIDGTLWSWGRCNYGQLGDNTTNIKLSPVQTIAGGTNWRQLSCGFGHTVTVKLDGTLWGWGRNSEGQLGDLTLVNKSSPVQTIAGSANWRQVSCGRMHTAAIKTDGTLWSWGYNNMGQIGDGTITTRTSPVQLITGGNDWRQVSCGYQHTAAIKTGGTIWCWGQNTQGTLGDLTVAHRSSPVQVVSGGDNWKLVASSGNTTLAIQINNINTTGT